MGGYRFREAMANTLVMRPCAAALSSTARIFRRPLPFSLQPTKVLLSRTSAVLLVRRGSAEQKLPLHNDDVVGLFSRPKFAGALLGRRRFSSRATNVNDAGSIDSPLMESMQNKIKEQLNAESVSVKDAYGDGRHVSIDVISSSFEGQSAVNRQRMVYKAIWEELQNTVHAVDQMTTKTPTEAAGQK